MAAPMVAMTTTAPPWPLAWPRAAGPWVQPGQLCCSWCSLSALWPHLGASGAVWEEEEAPGPRGGLPTRPGWGRARGYARPAEPSPGMATHSPECSGAGEGAPLPTGAAPESTWKTRPCSVPLKKSMKMLRAGGRILEPFSKGTAITAAYCRDLQPPPARLVGSP